MDVERIRDLVEATTALLESLRCTGIRRGEIQVVTEAHFPTDQCSASVGMNGGLEGALVLVFAPPDLAALASAVAQFPVEPAREEDINECMAELANLIAGHAGNRFYSSGIKIGITPPTLVCGPRLRVNFPDGARTVLIPFHSDQGGFDLLLSLLPDRPAG